MKIKHAKQEGKKITNGFLCLCLFLYLNVFSQLKQSSVGFILFCMWSFKTKKTKHIECQIVFQIQEYLLSTNKPFFLNAGNCNAVFRHDFGFP